MKTMIDLENAINNEARYWYVKQCQDQFESFYWYYTPSTKEYDGGIIILRKAPPNSNYQLACPEKLNPGHTWQHNANDFRIKHAGRLPVLSIR